MVGVEKTLRVAPMPHRADDAPTSAGEAGVGGSLAGDLVLTVSILLVSLLPFVCDRLGLGQWGAGSLGLGAVGVVLAARALCSLARHAEGRSRSWPSPAHSPGAPKR